MKKLFIVSFILFMLLNTCFLTNNVRANTPYDETFEGGVATTQLSDGQSQSGFLHSTAVHSTGTYITTASKRFGTYGYQGTGTVYGDTCVYFNFTGVGQYLTDFSLSQKSDSSYNKIWYFINSSTSTTLVELKTEGGSLFYKNDVGTYIEFGTYAENSWKSFGFNITDDTGITNYFLTGDLINSGIAKSPLGINLGYKIDTIKWFFPTGSTNYIDSFYFNLSTGYNPSGGAGGCEGETEFKTHDSGNYGNLPVGLGYGRYVESKYTDFTGLGITGNITDVSLSVGNNQYDIISNNLSKYTLVVNGFNCNNPSEWIPDGSDWLLKWNNLSIALTNNQPIFSFGCSEMVYTGQNHYWYDIGLTVTNPEYGFKYHNDSLLHTNAVYDGNGLSWDIIYKFNVTCYEIGEGGGVLTPDEFWNTALYFDFYDSKTGTKLNVWDWSTIGGSPSWLKNYCQLELILTAISLGGNTTDIYPSSTGVTLSNTYVTFNNVILAPYSLNKIDFAGKSAGNILGAVGGKPVIFNRYIDTLILSPLGHYNIYLVRYGDETLYGEIPTGELTDYISEYGDFFIEFKNENNTCEYRQNDYPILAFFVNNSLFSNVNGYIWEIQNEKNDTLKTGTIYFTGLNKSGFIPVNDWKFPKTGEYHIVLYNISSANTKYLMVYRSNNMQVCPLIDDGEPNILGIQIPEWVKLVIGVIIILFITIAPMLISYALSRGNIDIHIPALVYVAFFFLGTCISVALSLISIIIPFIVLFGLVLAFAIMWLRGNVSE